MGQDRRSWRGLHYDRASPAGARPMEKTTRRPCCLAEAQLLEQAAVALDFLADLQPQQIVYRDVLAGLLLIDRLEFLQAAIGSLHGDENIRRAGADAEQLDEVGMA